MSESSFEGVTELLAQARQGDEAALSEVAARVDNHLRRIAKRFLASESAGHTLQPTAVINEAWISLLGADGKLAVPDIASRGQFYAFAAAAMRNILVDHARRRRSVKRGGGQIRLPLDDRDRAVDPQTVELLAVHEALQRLESERPRAARVVELRYFGGATIEEAAAALEVSPETVKNDWRFAKAWLKRELGNE